MCHAKEKLTHLEEIIHKRVVGQNEAVEAVAKGEKYTAFDDKEESQLGGDRVVTTPDYTAYLKIAEGCDNSSSCCYSLYACIYLVQI